MLNKLLFHQFPNIKSLLTRLQYEFLSALNLKKDVLFMNFGYAAQHEGQEPIALDPEDEIHRYPLQLYHHIAKHVDWKNADALEVSCGRGGRRALHHAALPTEILHRRGLLVPRH